MTLTPPSSNANHRARQRFELELLLQRAVPNPDQLSRSKDLLQGAIPEISPEDWKRLQSVPIHSDPDHLDIAIPSDWRDKDWQRLIDQLPSQNRTIRLHPALDVDLQAVLHNHTAMEDVISEQLWPSRDGAESASSIARRSIRFWTDLMPKAFLKQNPTTTHHSPTTRST